MSLNLHLVSPKGARCPDVAQLPQAEALRILGGNGRNVPDVLRRYQASVRAMLDPGAYLDHMLAVTLWIIDHPGCAWIVA